MVKFLKSKKLRWLSIPIAVVLATALLVLYLPAGVSISTSGGIISLSMQVAHATVEATPSPPAETLPQTSIIDNGDGTYTYTNKWLSSYETLLFNTPDGDVDIGQYALDGTGTGYYIRTKPKTEGQFDHVDLTYDVSGLKRVNIKSGYAYYDEFLTAVGATNLWAKYSIYAGYDPSQLPSGSVLRIQSNAKKYWDTAQLKDYPQPSRTEIITVIPPEEPILPPQPVHSIALDATSNSGQKASVSSYSWSHTCTGSNLLLAFGDSHYNKGSDRTATGVTYNSVALTLIRSDARSGSAGPDTYYWRTTIYYLVAPATGSNTVSVTLSGTTDNAVGGVVSYTGVAQSGQPDANNGANGSDTTPTVNVTTIADNCWVFDAVVTISNLTCNNTVRWNLVYWGGADTNAPKTPAGSQTMSWTTTASNTWAISAASFAPVSVSVPTVVTGSASSITGSGASCAENVTATGGANVTSWGTQYGLTTSYGSNVTSTGNQGAAFGWSDALSNLSANTTYYYRGFAINSAGNGYGSSANFTTLTVSYTANQTTYNFGIVVASSTTNTTANWILFTNSSTVSTNISVQMLASTWTATSGGWTHSDSTAGVNTVAMKAASGNTTTWQTSEFIKYNAPFNIIAGEVPANSNYVSGLSLLAPTSFTNGVSNNNTVRFNFYQGNGWGSEGAGLGVVGFITQPVVGFVNWARKIVGFAK